MYEDGSRDEYLFKRVESIIIGIELLGNILPSKACQWNNNVWVVKNELVIRVSEIWKELNILTLFSSS